MANTVFPDYPQSAFGSKRVSLADIVGPTSYTQITVATPPTGGQTVLASDIGLTTIEWACTMGSDNGQYAARVMPGDGLAAGKGVSKIQLQWITAATGAQVGGAVNLGARSVRLIAFGY